MKLQWTTNNIRFLKLKDLSFSHKMVGFSQVDRSHKRAVFENLTDEEIKTINRICFKYGELVDEERTNN